MQSSRKDHNLRTRYRHSTARKLQDSPKKYSRPHAHSKKAAINDVVPTPKKKERAEDSISLVDAVAPTPVMPRTKTHTHYTKRPITHYSRPPRFVPENSTENTIATNDQQTQQRDRDFATGSRALFQTWHKLRLYFFAGQQPKKPQIAMLSGAAIVFVFGVTVCILGLRTNSHVEAQATNMARQSDEDADLNPDETEPSAQAIGSYRVAPDLPKRLIIPKINTNARIKALDTKSNNQLKAPTNIFDTGWYEKSAKPGENGAVLINGHVHGPRKPGVFAKLKTLAQGDTVSIERGDGQIFTYTVVKTQGYPADQVDMAAAMVPAVPGKQGLNIITCSGSLNDTRTGYEERLVVFAIRN